MDLWHLKIFKKVIDLEGFSRAAQAVHITQPTVSSHIRDLEEYFGCRLVDRMGRKAMPTKAGEILYQYACRLIALADEAEGAVAGFLGSISGKVSIGGSTIPGAYILPRQIGEFTKKYPLVSIRVEVADTLQIIEHILAGRLDFGIVGAESDNAQIVQQPIIEDQMRLIIRADHKWAEQKSVDLKNIFKEPFILREAGSGTLKTLADKIKQAKYSIEDFMVAAELGSTASVIQGIKSGMGISVLSLIAVKDELEQASLKALEIKGLDLTRNFYLTCHRARTLSPASTAFMDFIKEKTR
jgi:DNA-binding transcriptional LysR family regulator